MITLKEALPLWIDMGRHADIKRKEQSLIQDYPDSGIVLCRDLDRPIRKIAAMIDCTPFDVFFAKESGCDLIVTHHPIGRTAAGLPEMLLQQADNMAAYGVNPNTVRETLIMAKEKLHRDMSGGNFFREEQMAHLLGVDIVNIHTPADNAMVRFLSERLASLSGGTLGETVSMLNDLFEYREAKDRGQGPFLAAGEASMSLGRVALSEFIGGTESDASMIRALAEAGIETILCPHFSEEYFAVAKACSLSVIYCGHLASDSMGMNILLDALVERDPSVTVLSYGGLIRKG